MRAVNALLLLPDLADGRNGFLAGSTNLPDDAAAQH
jgi:hypothetical protein